MRLYKHLATPWFHIHSTWQATQSRAGFRILTFHDIPDAQIPAFERFLDYIQFNGSILSPSDVERDGVWAISRQYLLTFDDGFKSHVRIAELLAQRGIKALFFVCFGGNEEIAANIPTDRELMEWRDVFHITDLGHTVGAHTYTHRRLSSLPIDECLEELGAGFFFDTQWFAWPFGNLRSINYAIYEAMWARYRFICSGIRGLNTLPLRPHMLFRDPVHFDDEPWDYQRLALTGGLDFIYTNKRKTLQAWQKADSLSEITTTLHGI